MIQRMSLQLAPSSGVMRLIIWSLIVLLGIASVTPVHSQDAKDVDALPVFRLAHPEVTPEQIEQLASEVFEINGSAKKVNNRFIVADDNRFVDIYTTSGGVWFGDNTQLWNPDLKPELPDEDTAKAIADDFLQAHALLPKGDFFSINFVDFGYTQSATYDVNTQQRTEHVLDIQSIYAASIELPGLRLPVVGGGGEFNVTLGDQGEIIGYSSLWRDIQDVEGEFAVIPQEEADNLFLQSLEEAKVVALDSELAYYAAPSSQKQEFLYPVYVYRAVALIGDEEVPLRNSLIPATTFSVQAQITEPDVPITVPAEEPVTFQAKATLGTGPYTFVWESDIDGFLGEGEQIKTNLSAVQKDEQNTSHTVTVTITDANGMTATDAVVVTPEGKAAEAVLVPTVFEPFAPVNLQTSIRSGDDGRLEAGTSWIGETGGLPGSRYNAGGFIDELRADGWRINFNWGNRAAWHSDWTGNDDRYVDGADAVFYAGHANLNGWQQEAVGGDGWLSWDELGGSRDLWGENDLEWFIVAACGPLQDDLITAGGGDVFRWRDGFDGLHQMLGYGAVTFDNQVEGKTFVQYAQGGSTVIDSWFRTAREVQPTTNGWSAPDGPTIWVGVVYATQSGANPYNDHLHGYGPVSADPTAPTTFVAMWSRT